MPSVIVRGIPKPQGSKRPFAFKGKDGKLHASLVEQAGEALVDWRLAVIQEVRSSMLGGLWSKIESGPVWVSINFYLPRPKSRPHDVYCSVYPDIDKLTRAVYDALTIGGAIGDDKQIAKDEHEKLYENPSIPPGAFIDWGAL